MSKVILVFCTFDIIIIIIIIIIFYNIMVVVVTSMRRFDKGWGCSANVCLHRIYFLRKGIFAQCCILFFHFYRNLKQCKWFV